MLFVIIGKLKSQLFFSVHIVGEEYLGSKAWGSIVEGDEGYSSPSGKLLCY